MAGYVTRYVRRGVGRPVVVLGTAADAVWPELVDAIAARHRLFLPEVPAQEAGFVSWFRGFLDGVGLVTVTVIAAGDCCLPAVELALLDAERLDRLVLVPGGGAEETGLLGMLGTVAKSDAVPVLVLRRGTAPDQARRVIEPFLSAVPS